LILVDTSIWIDHLHVARPVLIELLGRDEVGCHPLVVEELAMGSIQKRADVLGLLASLHQFPVVTHDELLEFVDAHQLWGRGLSPVDAHLLGSVLLSPGTTLWTGAKRLRAAASDVGVAFT